MVTTGSIPGYVDPMAQAQLSFSYSCHYLQYRRHKFMICMCVEDDQETTPTELTAPTSCPESVSVAVEEVAKLFNQLKTRKPSDSPSSSTSAPVTPSPSFPQGKPMLTMIRRKLKARKKSSLLKETSAGAAVAQAPKARSLFKTSGSGGIWESAAQAWSSAPVVGAETEMSTNMLCRELVEELGVGHTLLKFLRELPIVKELCQSYCNGDLSSYWLGAVEAVEGDVKLTLLIKK